jgi:hypothetical protein
MVKSFIVAASSKAFVPVLACYTVLSFFFRESIGERLAKLLIPYAPELLSSIIWVCLVAIPLLYWNQRTRFYSAAGLAIIGILLLSATWFGQLSLAYLLITFISGVGCIAICIKITGDKILDDRDVLLEEAPASAPKTYAFAMGIIWLKTALMVAFSFGVIPMIMEFDEKPEYMSILMALTGCYLVFIGFGLALRWKVALPLALWGECSVAYTVYNQAAAADWNNTLAAVGQLFPIFISVLGAIAMMLLLSPSNLSYYFSQDEETKPGPRLAS